MPAARLVLDSAFALAPVPRRLFGSFVEHMGRCVYTGIYEPGHPLADADGYVFSPDVDPVSQMVNMISASRNYQAGVEMLNTAKELALATLTMGR